MTNYRKVQRADTDYLDRLLLVDGLVRMVPSDTLRGIQPDHLLQWCVAHALYQLPTTELIAWLRDRIAGRRAIEICAGRCCLGRFLQIPMTDNFIQTTIEFQVAYMEMHNQMPCFPPEFVEKLDANDAVVKYDPEVVIGSWVTSHAVNEMGPMESLIVQRADYIHVGNIAVHGDKPILKRPHECLYYPWLASRAFDPMLNRIWQWRRVTAVGA
jgi:hypothetical protein